MNWDLFFTIVTTASIFMGLWWMIRRDLKSDLDKRFEAIDKQFEAIMTTISKLSERITSIDSWLQAQFGRVPPAIFLRHSPLGLTEYGEGIAKDLGAYTWANEVAAILQDQVQGKEAYEIQEYCFGYTKSELTSQLEKAVKKVAYERGIKDKDVRGVLAIVLRDKLLDMQLSPAE